MTQAPQTASSAPVLQEVRNGSVLTLVMNRPDRLNALNNELTSALNDALIRESSKHSIVGSGGYHRIQKRIFHSGPDLVSREHGVRSAIDVTQDRFGIVRMDGSEC